jgi:hypothetical protein
MHFSFPKFITDISALIKPTSSDVLQCFSTKNYLCDLFDSSDKPDMTSHVATAEISYIMEIVDRPYGYE